MENEEKIILYGSLDLAMNVTSTSDWITNEFPDHSYTLPLAGVCPTTNQRSTLEDYVNNTRDPMGKFFKSKAIENPKAPIVASFSSRGPSTVVPDILKPDISAPGVEILAAWSTRGALSEIQGDNRSSLFNIICGTSVACRHTAGAALYIKSSHPSWSPSAVKSALMTTASPMSADTHSEDELA